MSCNKRDAMPLFSIIIPAYNAERYLPSALDSVLAQKASSYEVILVDDGSTDGTAEICDGYADRYDCIRTIHVDNSGASCARNMGLTCACGEYVLFMDADDLWKPEFLSVVCQLLTNQPDMILFGSEKFGEGGAAEQRCCRCLPSGETGESWLGSSLNTGAVPPPYLWSYAYRRKFLIEHNLKICEELECSEDFDLNMRAIPLAKHIIGTGQVLYRWRQVPTSLSHTISAQKLMDNLVTKAEAYRRFPCGALADLYMDNAVLLAQIPRHQAQSCIVFVWENRDICGQCTQLPLKLAAKLFVLFGAYNGALVYRILRRIKQGKGR